MTTGRKKFYRKHANFKLNVTRMCVKNSNVCQLDLAG